ncbi:MAG: hypothetical protein RLZZ254_1340, partial [Actinomycetota bacterium]
MGNCGTHCTHRQHPRDRRSVGSTQRHVTACRSSGVDSLIHVLRAVYCDYSVHCPSCSFDDTKVIDSRVSEEGTAVRRRRSCLRCEYRFTTYERLEELPLVVV